MSKELNWETRELAQDELSVMLERRARLETSEQLSAAALDSQQDHFWPIIEKIADFCNETLEKHRFPRASESVRHDGEGNWWRHPDDSPPMAPKGQTWKLILGKDFVTSEAPGFSDPWYAAEIGFLCHRALYHHKKGDDGAPFLFSLIARISDLRADWRWRKKHKPSILTGRKQRKTLDIHRDSAITKSQAKVKERRIRVAEYMAQTKLQKGALENHLIEKLSADSFKDVSRRTVRRDIREIRRAQNVGQEG